MSLIVPRDYQAAASNDFWLHYDSGKKSVMLYLATGLGKTIVMGLIALEAQRRGLKVLTMAHMDQLLDSASKKYQQIGCTGDFHFEQGDRYVSHYDVMSHSAKMVFAMVQSMHRRLDKYPKDYFDLIITDETHHAAAVTYRKIYKHFETAAVFGPTATPIRSDKVGLDTVFEVTSNVRIGLEKGIELGWLVPLRPKAVRIESLDYSKINLGNGKRDFTEEEIESALTSNGCKPLLEIAAGIDSFARHKQSVIFTSGFSAATYLTKILEKDYGFNVAFIHKDTDTEERGRILERFRSREISKLVNIGVLTEGVDLPNAEFIGIAKATISMSRYLQMAGRGTRPYPDGLVDMYKTPEERVHAIMASPKPECLLVDFKGNLGRYESFCIDGLNLLAGIKSAIPLDGDEDPNTNRVIEVGRREENDGATIAEIRQAAIDDMVLDEIINSPVYSLQAEVKEMTVQDHSSLFQVPQIPKKERDERREKYIPLPQEIRCSPDKRAQIIFLRRKAGMPEPTTNYLLSLSQKKANRVIGELIGRLSNGGKYKKKKGNRK